MEPCAVHGGAHSDNLIKTVDGSIVLIDFERFAFGPPETDLAVTALEHGLGWGTRAEYDQFARAVRVRCSGLGWLFSAQRHQ
ncbi:phosphotransferase [Nonomuraea sp. NPDC049419]|uniref:phosphotransferase family protein n=1 Tax=Nonomuraea sp. NPDC049419 TaxID=3155772 RepID=UPI00343253DB